MNEYIKEIEEIATKCSCSQSDGYAQIMRICEAIKEQHNGWIPCSERLPEMPKENPLFEYKPLEVYLVSLSSTDYPWRAFWNGKYFTDGFSKVEPIAWMPLPAPYKKENRV